MKAYKELLIFATIFLLVFLLACSKDSTNPEELNSDIPADNYKPVPPPAQGPLKPALAVEQRELDNPGRIRLTVGGILSPVDNLPLVYSVENLTIVEDGIVKGYKITLGQSAGLKSDIAFIVDNSTTMTAAIEGVKNSLLAFINAMQISGQDIRAGIVAFSDNLPINFPNNVDPTDTRAHASVYGYQDLTDSLAENESLYQYITTLSVFSPSSDIDLPELCFAAIDYARRTFSWRKDAQRIYIIITDAYSWGKNAPDFAVKGIDPDYYTDESLCALLLADGSVVHTYCPAFNAFLPTGQYNVSTLSTQTGGVWTQFSQNLDLTALPIIEVTAASALVEFLKNGSPNERKERTLRAIVEVITGSDTTNGEREVRVSY